MRHRNTIPMSALFFKKKPVKRRTFQFLFGTAAAIMILPFITDRIRIGFDKNFQVVLPFFSFQIYIYNDAENISNFVGNIGKKFMGVRNAGYCSFIVFSYKELSPIGIGKATYPFDIFIPPRLFPLYILALLG
jgi:hypothetical protein